MPNRLRSASTAVLGPPPAKQAKTAIGNLNGTVDRTSRVSAADILGGAKAAKKDKDGEAIDIPVAEPEAE